MKELRESLTIVALRNELAEYKQRAEAVEAKLRALEMQEPYGWYDTSVGQMFFSRHPRDPEYEVPLYAKPFPAPKQEEK